MAGRPRASAPKDTPRNFSREGGFADPRQPLHEESALGRGLMILRAFDIGEPYLGNAAIAERTGLAKATVSRLTQTLLELGYLLYRADLVRKRPEFFPVNSYHGDTEVAYGILLEHDFGFVRVHHG